jgi:hypothetical protein
MNLIKASGPTRGGDCVGSRDSHRLGRLIDLKAKQSRRKNQHPLGRRAAYLERQRRVADRTAKKEAGTAAKASPASSLRILPVGRRSNVHSLDFPSRQVADRRAAFAAGIARAEQNGPRWNGSLRLRWQVLASVQTAPHSPTANVSFIRNSAAAPSPPSTATGSPSSSTAWVKSASSTAS